MNATVLLVVLAVGWVAITGGFTLPNLLLGVLIAAGVLFLFRHRLSRPMAPSRFWRAVRLAGLFVYELLISAFAVARLAVTPGLATRLKPAIIAFPLTAKSDAEITLLANLITLTPGTLSLDVSADRRRLYVHVLVLHGREDLLRNIADGFEKSVMDVFR